MKLDDEQKASTEQAQPEEAALVNRPGSELEAEDEPEVEDEPKAEAEPERLGSSSSRADEEEVEDIVPTSDPAAEASEGDGPSDPSPAEEDSEDDGTPPPRKSAYQLEVEEISGARTGRLWRRSVYQNCSARVEF